MDVTLFNAFLQTFSEIEVQSENQAFAGGQNMAKELICGICGKKLKQFGFNDKVMVKGKAYICADCCKKAGHNLMTWTGALGTSLDEIRDEIARSENNDCRDNSISDGKQAVKFKATKTLGKRLLIDETDKLWAVQQDVLGLKRSSVHNLNDIINYELIEDGTSVIKGGIGSAMIGGAFLGMPGALLGGMTGQRKIIDKCTSLKITVNNLSAPTEYIEFISGSINKNSSFYKMYLDQAREIISSLEIICKENEKDDHQAQESMPVKDETEEIRKYKQLLDDGIITTEEFEAKKKQILNL